MGLYDDLLAKNAAIAAEYKAVAGDKGVVTKDGLIRILKKAVDPKGSGNKFIDTGEASALVLIVEANVLDADAVKLLNEVIMSKQGREAVLNGASVVLAANDPELTNFHSVFAIKFTGNVKFYSPGTKHTYSRVQYQAVAQLVKDGKIQVVKVLDGGLSAQLKAGDNLYLANMNAFFFFEHKNEKFFSNESEIVHEATHAVQDWFDVNSVVKYVETDAYIAQALAGAKLKKEISDAADLVRKGKGTKGNKDWEKAYEAAATLVASDPVYAARKDDPTTDMIEKDGAERKKMDEIIAALAAAAKKEAAKKAKSDEAEAKTKKNR